MNSEGKLDILNLILDMITHPPMKVSIQTNKNYKQTRTNLIMNSINFRPKNEGGVGWCT